MKQVCLCLIICACACASPVLLQRGAGQNNILALTEFP
ncbi:hypothetical protein GLYMA_05G034850v4 [Glycine max]|nr:hypothetical protein GLYMA_05G034850v4 [Glycine max]KAH1132627.1 hypothetical protein GYH30_011460 [Glycine max]